jgi:hypothetical protein
MRGPRVVACGRTPHVAMRTAKGRLAALAAGAREPTPDEADMLALPGAVTCDGWMRVIPTDRSAGIFAAGSGPRKEFWWALLTECTVIGGDPADTPVLKATGPAEGWCGQSVSRGGTGRLGDLRLFDIRWRSAGTLLMVTAAHDGGGQGRLEARVVLADPAQDCTASPHGLREFEVWAVEVELR